MKNKVSIYSHNQILQYLCRPKAHGKTAKAYFFIILYIHF